MTPWVLVAAIVATMGGCQSQPVNSTTPEPEQLAIKLYRAGREGQYTYFELSKAGELAFAGGREATHRLATPVTTLSAEQIRGLWDIVVQEKLLDAPGEFALSKGDRVTWDMEIRSDRGGRSFHSVDEKVPGLQRLHDALFQIQADVRYKLPGLK